MTQPLGARVLCVVLLAGLLLGRLDMVSAAVPPAAPVESQPAAFDGFSAPGWPVGAGHEDRAWPEPIAQAPLPENRRAIESHRRADEQWEKGQALEQAQRYLEAAEAYRRSAETEKASGRPRRDDLAAALERAGLMYQAAGRYPEAEPLLREALAIRQAILPAGHPDLAVSLNNLAELLRATGRYADAELLYRKARALLQAARSAGHPNIATVLNNLAELLRATGRYAEAELLYREALALRQAARPANYPVIADSLNNLAVFLQTVGRYAEAERLYLEALTLAKATLPPGHRDIAGSLSNLATLFQMTGRYAEAEPLLREALAIWKAALLAGHTDFATGLKHLAIVLQATGRYAEAEPLYREALSLRRSALPKDHPDIADSLSDLALLFQVTGRYAEAEPLLREALALRKAALPADHPHIAISLNNLAVLLRMSGRYAEAESLYREALTLSHALPAGHPDVAIRRNNLAVLLETMGRVTDAEPLYREALALRQAALPPGHPDLAASLNNLAGLLQATGRPSAAEPLLREALGIAQGGGSPQHLWTIQGNLAQFHAARDQRPLAIFFGKQAVNTLQTVRHELAAAQQATQQAFVRSKEHYYRDLADWLIAEGRLPEAQQVLEMLKSIEYLEYTRRSEAAHAHLQPIALDTFETRQADRLAAAATPLQAIYRELQTLQRIHPTVRTAAEQQRIAALTQQQPQVALQFSAALTEVLDAFAQLDNAEQRRLAAEHQRLGIDRRALVAKFEGAMLVQYLVLKDHLRILVTTPHQIIPRSHPISAEALNRQVADYYTRLQSRHLDPRPLASPLHAALIAPITDLLERERPRLVLFSLDGVLRYLPIASLHDGQHYLIQTFTVALFAETDSEQLLSAPQTQWRAAGFGVSQAHGEFSALPAVVDEINGIVREGAHDPRGILDGRKHLDAAFTAQRFRERLTERFPVVHLASHFHFRPGTERDSFLLLGDGNRLDLGTLRTGDFSFTGVELVTLSACETAVGGRNAQGQEIDGLGTLVRRLGARGVLATLWPVADASTGRFMQHFYQLRVEQHLTKAEALRQAQLAFLRGTAAAATDAMDVAPAPARDLAADPAELAAPADRGRVVRLIPAPDLAPAYTPDPEAPYAHPYYWAPFILMGNWR